MSDKIMNLAEFLLASLAAIMIVLSLSTIITSCALTQRLADNSSPTCDEVKEHLTSIGCFADDFCNDLVHQIIEEKITPSIPDGIPFALGCDMVISTGILPVDCVMAANDYDNVVTCIGAF